MNLRITSFVIVIVLFSVFATAFAIFIIDTTHAYGQAQTQSKTSTDYVQNARSLLKQVSTGYKNGNYAKAEELAEIAYLDNFEYVEADLQKRGQSDLVEELEKMMVSDLRGMIKDRVSQDQLDAEISAIDAKLAEAQIIVPEFPIDTAIAIITLSAIGCIIAFTRLKGSTRDMLPTH